MQSCEAIARAYDAAPSEPSARARRAYRLVAAYTDSRYFGSLPRDGWRAEPTYSDALPDIAEAQRLRVVPTYDLWHNHPCLSDAENYRFRAIHDVYGHEWVGTAPLGFGVENEREAAQRQIADFQGWIRGQVRGLRIVSCAVARRLSLNAPAATEPNLLRDACAALCGEIYGQAAYYEARGAFPTQKAFLLSPTVLA